MGTEDLGMETMQAALDADLAAISGQQECVLEGRFVFKDKSQYDGGWSKMTLTFQGGNVSLQQEGEEEQYGSGAFSTIREQLSGTYRASGPKVTLDLYDAFYYGSDDGGDGGRVRLKATITPDQTV